VAGDSQTANQPQEAPSATIFGTFSGSQVIPTALFIDLSVTVSATVCVGLDVDAGSRPILLADKMILNRNDTQYGICCYRLTGTLTLWHQATDMEM
jgi:hypothetical protein